MKLNKKLLTLATVSTCATSIVPFALTSCSNSKMYHYEFGDGDISWPKEIGQFDFTRINFSKTEDEIKKQCNDLYFEDIKNNNEIFARDLATNCSLGLFKSINSLEKGNENLHLNITELSFDISNINIGETQYEKTDGVGYYNIPTISFKCDGVIRLKGREEVPGDDGETEKMSIYTYSGSFSQTISNLPLQTFATIGDKKIEDYRAIGLALLWIGEEVPGIDFNKELFDYTVDPWSIDYSFNLSQHVRYIIGGGEEKEESQTFSTNCSLKTFTQAEKFLNELKQLPKWLSGIRSFINLTFGFDFKPIYMSEDVSPC